MKPNDPLEEKFAVLKESAPEGFHRRVMNALPAPRVRRVWWPGGLAWLPPAMLGASAVLMLNFLRPLPSPAPAALTETARLVRFEFRAADASEVQLVGTFTDWETGRIRLQGPDPTGHWTVELQIPEGRHEYGFLVDGHLWVADPLADLKRDDGFGRLNAILEI